MSRLFARAELPIDLGALRSYLDTIVMSCPQVFQGSGRFYGGWSVTSASPDYRDGWQSGLRRQVNGELGAVEPESREFDTIFPVHPRYMRVPTDICRGPVKALMDEIDRRCAYLGAAPARARLAKLEPGHQLSFHVDASVEQWRLHVPIVTNPACCFEWDLDGDATADERLHMPAGGAWFVRVDQRHRFVNGGATARVHLVMSLSHWRGDLAERFNAIASSEH